MRERPFPGRWTVPDDPDQVCIPPWPVDNIQVTEIENPVVSVLYGPDGDVLMHIKERRTVPFGYQKWEGQ